MKNIIDVYKDINNSKIDIDEHKFDSERSAVIVKSKEQKHYIFIDNNKIDTLIEKKCILAEEYAHYKTGTLYGIDSEFETIDRLETRAKKYQIKYLVPKNELIKEIQNGCHYYCELAEKFGVTENIIRKAIDLYSLEYELLLV